MDLANTVSIVSGGASGLGEATARRFAAAESQVAILDLDDERGRAVVDELDGVFIHCDVADAEATEQAMARVVELLGPPRIAVCCAGIGSGRRVVGRNRPHDAALFERVVGVNLTGTFNICRLAAWEMQQLEPVDAGGERGVLITTASIAAEDGVDGGVAYAASKAGVAGMTLPLARDLAPHGIRAVSIAPGSFETPMVATMPAEFRDRLSAQTPFPPRFGLPDEYASLAQHIVENSMLNGAMLRIDGGLRMTPSDDFRRGSQG